MAESKNSEGTPLSQDIETLVKHQSVHEKLQEINKDKGPEGNDSYEVTVKLKHLYMVNGAGTMDYMGFDIASFDNHEGMSGQVYAFPGGLTVKFKDDEPCDRWQLDISSLVTEVAAQRVRLNPLDGHKPDCPCADCAKARVHLKRGLKMQAGEERLIDHA